jgi:hypothetical protein
MRDESRRVGLERALEADERLFIADKRVRVADEHASIADKRVRVADEHASIGHEGPSLAHRTPRIARSARFRGPTGIDRTACRFHVTKFDLVRLYQ